MDVIDAVRTRIEVREYSDESVDDETKREILDAGRLASSGHNSQHWQFVLVDDDEQLSALADVSPTGGWVGDAAFAIAVCTDPSYPYNEIDAGRAITHMQLVAWEQGIGSCLYTVGDPAASEVLAVPEEYDLTLVAGFGYPVHQVAGVKDREPLSAVAARGSFDSDLELSDRRRSPVTSRTTPNRE